MYGSKITACYGLKEPLVSNEERIQELMKNGQLLLDQEKITKKQFKECFEGTNAQWVEERTGIKYRGIAPFNRDTSDLVVDVIKGLLNISGLNKNSVQSLFVSTATPSNINSPATAAVAQAKAELPVRIAAYDVSSACSSFIYGLWSAYNAIRNRDRKNALVVGAEILSRAINPNDRTLALLLADGAGGFLLEKTNRKNDSFFKRNPFYFYTDGKLAKLIYNEAGGSKTPNTPEIMNNPLIRLDKLMMEGPKLFEEMVRLVPMVMREALEKAKLNLKDIDFIILHQANLRITRAIEKRLKNSGLRPETIVYSNIENTGNTSSASIPLAINDAWHEGILKPGMLVMAVAFGGGITIGSSLFTWSFLSCC